MNWVCPSCGANDNEESSIKCSCGYILEEGERSNVRWVEAIIPAPPPPPLAENIPLSHRTLKYKLGYGIYVFSVITLVTVAAILLITNWFPSKRTVAAIISSATLINTYSSLLTEDIGIKGVGTVRRDDAPRWFWSQFSFQATIGVVFALIAIFIRE